MDTAINFQTLLSGLRAGDPAAVDTVYRRYGPILRNVVRKQLNPRLRTRFDSIDFVQDVWLSFLKIPPERLNFDDEEGLVAYLGQVAHHRVIERFRQRFQSQKADVQREVDGDAFAPIRDHQAKSTPTPSMCVVADEEWDRMVRMFPEGHRVILEHLRDGRDYREIAELTNVSVSTVNRIVRRLKEITGVE